MKYIILGDPIPLARARISSSKMYDAQRQLKLVIGLNLAKQHGDNPLFSGPLAIFMEFHMAIPKRAKRNIIYTPHIYRPDLDNMVKFILDVSNDVLYDDDCLVAELRARKFYSDSPRTEFIITEIINDKE